MTSNPIPYGIQPEGHRLPEEAGLGPVRLQVRDLERSLDYYLRVLGLRVLDEGGGRVLLAPEEGAPVLVELRERAGASPVPPRGHLGLFHFALLLPDRAHLGRFAAHLARLGAPAGASDHRVSEALYLRDPDGLGIEVYADRPRAEWRREGRQIVMATDPLDVEALIEAGGDVPWTGMPPGTALGHIHLHVGDLEQAEAFYHRALGLDKVVWSYPGALFLSAGGYHHHLGVNTWARGARPAAEDEARLLEWELRLPREEDVSRVRGSLEGAGHSVREGGRGFGVQDPWGTALRVRVREPSASRGDVGETSR